MTVDNIGNDLNKETAIKIESGHRLRGLDWAQASWTRWIYVAFWWWMNPILNIGYRGRLTDEDLFQVSFNDECKKLLGKLECKWQQSNDKSTWKIILATFWKEILLPGLILIPYTGVKIAQPIFLKRIVLAINDPDGAAYVGYLYAMGLGLSSLSQAFIHHQYFFHSMRAGAQVRIALSTLIYKKLLSLPSSALVKTTTGQLINLVSNDVGKFEELSAYGHHMWAAPIEAAVIFGIIWNEIGIPTLFGYAVLLLLAPLQTIFSRKFGSYRKNTMRWTDKRVKVVNEILVGCQIVKMYRWEEAMENVVYEARTNEFKSIRKAGRIRAINLGISFASSVLISLATFGGSYLMGRTLVPATIFMILSLFSLIRFPLTVAFPVSVEKSSECLIASRRIDEFLKLSDVTLTKLEKKMNSDAQVSTEKGAIAMNDASFSWNATAPPTLSKVTLNIKSGSLVGVFGSIGAGKSSLLSAILKEMCLVGGDFQLNGSVAFVSQNAWIFAGTIRENILFSQSFDQTRYDNVIKACCLAEDLKAFQAADSTVIGEKGVNLSGGQRARISLARAVYANADIYLMDDPLAAVDSRVAKSIFQQCISNQGLLKTKTRLLVTHRLEFLPHFDQCLLFENGKIERQGSFEELLQIDKIKIQYEKHLSHENSDDQNSSRHNVDDTDVLNEKVSNNDKNSIVKEENSAAGSVSIKVWLKLFTAGYGYFGLVVLVLLIVLAEVAYDATNKWLSMWSSQSEIDQRQKFYPWTYLGLVLVTWILALVRADMFFHLILRGASSLHNRMFKGVLYSSLRFFESNPVGRILNRFSKDQQVIDEALPLTFFDAIQALIMVLGSIVIIGIANPWVLLILILIIPAFVWLRRFYLKSSREIKRLESIARSPIYALFSSSLSGLATIRAFRVQEQFIDAFVEKVNAHTRVFIVFIAANRWFGFRLDLMTCCLTTLTAFLSVALKNSIDPSAIALGLSYCISLTAYFQWGVRQSAETENAMTSAERIDEYASIPPESNFHVGEIEPPSDWPNQGLIEFKNFKMRYRPELDHVLKGLNLLVEPKNKIGIIGRTGAGKSSIFQALFRLTESSTTEGQIFIDGVDISKISLNSLRSHLNSIPQSPVLFSNTLRYNLDPFQRHTDDQLWDALQAVQLKTKIFQMPDQLSTPVAEYGSNFSVGECQLICVARAILKPSKILLIDEATAHVDHKTDELIQQVLREKFMSQTILTIAHRLNTIMDSDKIVLMKDGVVAEYGSPRTIIKSDHESEAFDEQEEETLDSWL